MEVDFDLIIRDIDVINSSHERKLNPNFSLRNKYVFRDIEISRIN